MPFNAKEANAKGKLLRKRWLGYDPYRYEDSTALLREALVCAAASAGSILCALLLHQIEIVAR